MPNKSNSRHLTKLYNIVVNDKDFASKIRDTFLKSQKSNKRKLENLIIKPVTPYYSAWFETVELRSSDREIDLTGITVKTIQIPEYVTVIEKGVFDGLTDVVIQTAYESKPDGWENGWNGNCTVEWGAEF